LARNASIFVAAEHDVGEALSALSRLDRGELLRCRLERRLLCRSGGLHRGEFGFHLRVAARKVVGGRRRRRVLWVGHA
jgi:hypothetical protein